MEEKQRLQHESPSGIPERSKTADKQLTGRRLIQQAAARIRDHISRQPPVQRHFSFMPTLLTRVSPFHFQVRVKVADWPLVRLDTGDSSPWGRMRVVGELLVIFDETVLFSLLSVMAHQNSEVFETTLAGICRLAGIEPDTRQCNAVWRSIQRLAGTRIDLELTSGKGKKRKVINQMTGSILSFADMQHDKHIVRVIINPYFIELYAESLVTNIDLKFRSQLKNDLSKALYRFYQGQYAAEISTDLLRLARAVNLDSRQPSDRLRTKMRACLKELQAKGYLADFQIDTRDRVTIAKAKHTAIDWEGQILGGTRTPFLSD